MFHVAIVQYLLSQSPTWLDEFHLRRRSNEDTPVHKYKCKALTNCSVRFFRDLVQHYKWSLKCFLKKFFPQASSPQGAIAAWEITRRLIDFLQESQ